MVHISIVMVYYNKKNRWLLFIFKDFPSKKTVIIDGISRVINLDKLNSTAFLIAVEDVLGQT